VENEIHEIMEIATFDQLKELFQKTDERMEKLNRETDRKFAETREELRLKSLETDRKFQELVLENDKRIKEIHEELGGIGKSNGQVAEEFFYTALENIMQVGKLKFDYIENNLHRKHKKSNIEAQYDIILYNDYKILIVEVKYNFKKKYLLNFYKNIKNFKILLPQYKDYTVYGAIAGMTIEEDAIIEATEFGFLILTQNNQNIQILNAPDFEPNAIK